ncbi:MAG: HNH endonuclease [Xanthobacteraceae bacterium]
MSTLLCRLVWANEYRSKKETFFPGNMKYPAITKNAHELLNFADEDGFAYGFVENNRKRINLGSLGAPPGAPKVEGVSVIWCALDKATRRLRVVGWYDNATVYSEPQVPRRNSPRGDWRFQCKAKVEDAHLIPEAERYLEVPMKPTVIDTGYIGQTNWFFPERSPHYARFLESFALIKVGARLSPSNPGAANDRTEFSEGQRQITEINLTSRNPQLVAAAKQRYGYRCQVCNFSFEERYGELGREFIEVHHLVPIGSPTGLRTSTVDDVRVVCANCHRMIHKRRIPLDLPELQKLLR